MKNSIHRLIIPGLAVLCGIAAVALVPAVHLPRTDDGVATPPVVHRRASQQYPHAILRSAEYGSGD